MRTSGFLDPRHPNRSPADIPVELSDGFSGLALPRRSEPVEPPFWAPLCMLVDRLVVAFDPAESFEALENGVERAALDPRGAHEGEPVLFLGWGVEECPQHLCARLAQLHIAPST